MLGVTHSSMFFLRKIFGNQTTFNYFDDNCQTISRLFPHVKLEFVWILHRPKKDTLSHHTVNFRCGPTFLLCFFFKRNLRIELVLPIWKLEMLYYRSFFSCLGPCTSWNWHMLKKETRFCQIKNFLMCLFAAETWKLSFFEFCEQFFDFQFFYLCT